MTQHPSLEDVEIESERLRLVPTSEAHAPDILRYFTPQVTRFMGPPPAIRLEDTLAFLQGASSALLAGTDLQMAVLLKNSGDFVGMAGLHHIDTLTPELGV